MAETGAPALRARRFDPFRDPALLAGCTLGVVLSGLWTWWGLEAGGFFESVAYPGAILLFLTLAMLLFFAPIRLALKGPHAVALGAMLGLFAWTLLSLLWTPSRDVALEDACRVLIYAVSFLAGLMLANLLGRRAILAILPYCLAGAIVAAVTTIALLGVDASQDLLADDGTLQYPIKYRNANSAFFVGVALATLGVAAPRTVPVPVGALAAGLAALCLDLAILSQSRGSVLALAIGALALFAFSRDRLRLLALMLCVAGPVALATPTLLDPFSVAEGGTGAAAELRAAGEATILTAAGAAMAALAALVMLNRAEPRLRLSQRARLSLTAGALALAVAAGAAFLLSTDDPVDWVDNQVSSRFSESGGNVDARFLYTGGQNRGDFWRVSINAAEEHPLIGEGSGSFRQRYALERRSIELPLDAHSLPVETLAELGIIGLALLVLAAGAAVVAARRSARLGPEMAALSASALGAGTYYAAHASIDWLWSFPGLTAPVLGLLGMASAPAARSLRPLPRAVSRPLAGAVALLALALAPLFLSARLASEAESRAATDPAGARDQLERAAGFNPFADRPYLRAADIARSEGETQVAIDALEKAREREPVEWVNYALAAELLLTEDPGRARVELRKARELNPGEEALDEIERLLRRSISSDSGGGGAPR